MFTSHNQYINSNNSEKVVLAHIHGSKRLYNFTLDSGTYSRPVDYFVNNVTVNSTLLSRVNSIAELIDSNKYYYDVTNGQLHLFDYDNDTDEVVVEFRFFLSNIPIILPWDLSDTGAKVNYEPRIVTIPKFQTNMAQGKSGLNLIGKGDLIIHNNDAFYDAIYDTLFWENRSVNIYSFHRSLSVSEAQIFFRGVITGKSFSSDKITFSLTDELYSLEQNIPSTQYGELVPESDSTNYKRIVYGKLVNLKVQSLDKYGDSGIGLTGTLSGVTGNDYITGSGTFFTSQLSSGDKLEFDGFSVTVDEVKSDTVAKTSELDRTFSGLTASVKPEVQYSQKNRTFQVCNHAIKKVTTTITSIKSRNRIVINDPSEFEAGDTIDINGEEKKIKRISGNTLVLTTNYNLDHSIGDTVTKKDVYNVRYDTSNTISPNDITVSNSPTGTTIALSANAEINAAKTQSLKQGFTFINGSSGVWLGSPARHKIELASGDKYSTYFTIYDVEGDTTAFWFKDTAPVASSAIKEPDHGADNSVPISLLVNDPALDSLSTSIVNAINANIDHYYAYKSGTDIILDSVNPEPISQPLTGSSGFSMSTLTIGYTPDYKTDLTEIMKPRDYIVCPDGVSREILQVFEKSIKLRGTYQGATGVHKLLYKNVEYINDDSTVYVDCYGKTKDGTSTGELIKTGPEIVEDILKDVGLSNYINASSFIDSSVRAPQLMSLALPIGFNDIMPTAKDVINKINKSILGSIFIDNNLNLGYDILDSEIPLNTLETIADDDVIKWSISGDSFDVVKSVTGNYRFTDYSPTTDSPSNSQVSYNSDFVTKYIGNDNSKELDLYLYEKDQAKEMVERDQFINSLSTTVIKISGSLNLSKFSLGQRVLLNFRRLYTALGSDQSSLRVGVISSIKSNGEKVEVEVLDLGSIYSRSSRITSDSSEDYSASTGQERLVNSFITDDNGIIDDDEATFSTNLIS